ncbi:odorant receptor 49b-like [Cryptotermes secundus]|uniref:odorant receptor 49b-like n=1 Tax=Cryptotermes secundus TaxID=105785 RepID=UPI001454CEFE|nr:odorant receptor 49b-like [Cryptotermes secundus]
MYTADALLQIGLPCWFATQLQVHGGSIAEAAYACEWYNESIAFQKSVGLIMMRAQRPVVLTLGPFGTVSLELFAAVVQSAYSYLTLLRQVYAGK